MATGVDDEDYELMQPQTDHLYCVVPERPGKCSTSDSMTPVTNNRSSALDRSTQKRQIWAERNFTSGGKRTPAALPSNSTSTAKPRMYRSMTTPSVDRASLLLKEQGKKYSSPDLISSPLYEDIHSTGLGLEQLGLDPPPVKLPIEDNEDQDSGGNYVNIKEMAEQTRLSGEMIRLTEELTASHKREESLLRRINQQDKRIDMLQGSMDSLKAEFNNILSAFTLTPSVQQTLQQKQPHLSEIRCHPPCDFVMKQFTHHQSTVGMEWYSHPFYSGPDQGYKMCLQIIAHGMEMSAGTNVSICIKLMKGEYDSQLKFPFLGDITVQILNQLGDYKHATRVISFDADAMKYGACCCVYQGSTETERAELGWGISAFIPHSYLPYNKQQRTEFIKNDSLNIRIAKIVHE